MGSIQPADPAARRRALWTISIVTVAGFAAILAFEYYRADFEAWLEQNIDFLLENSIIVLFASLALFAPIIAAGIYVLLLGNRIVRARRFPPPGQMVARNTPVLEGRRAVGRGRLLQWLATILLLAAAAAPLVLWHVFRAVGKATR